MILTPSKFGQELIMATTIDDVWSILAEITGKQSELTIKQQELAQSQQKTDQQISRLTKEIGSLGGSWGRFVENI